MEVLRGVHAVERKNGWFNVQCVWMGWI